MIMVDKAEVEKRIQALDLYIVEAELLEDLGDIDSMKAKLDMAKGAFVTLVRLKLLPNPFKTINEIKLLEQKYDDYLHTCLGSRDCYED